jgi:rhodanese-related sulfurtransferase
MKGLGSSLFIYLVILVSIVVIAGTGMAAGDPFNYITSEETRSKIESGEIMTLLDIQVEDEYARHHIKGSLATYGYPVKTEEEKAKLDKVIPDLTAGTDPVIIICPQGGGGARRTFEHLLSRGIESGRLFILEKGQSGWPYPDYVESKVHP